MKLIVPSNFGAPLTYANSRGTGGAAYPQTLADTTIPSDTEVIVMLVEKCNSGNYGYVRPGLVAHQGFDGADKVFSFEFGMALDGKLGVSKRICEEPVGLLT